MAALGLIIAGIIVAGAGYIGLVVVLSLGPLM